MNKKAKKQTPWPSTTKRSVRICQTQARSINNDELNKLVERILPIFEEACEAENKRWNATEETKIKLSIEPIGHRPAGDQQNDSPILLAARASMNHLGIALTTYGCASTDQNVALSLGIPATTLGGGGKEGYNHSLKPEFGRIY